MAATATRLNRQDIQPGRYLADRATGKLWEIAVVLSWPKKASEPGNIGLANAADPDAGYWWCKLKDVQGMELITTRPDK